MDNLIIHNLDNFGLLDKGYELYLRDFINNSKYFKKQYGKFTAPVTECHGEDDANAASYTLDFKRFMSQDECKYRHYNDMPTRYIIRKTDSFNKTHGHFDMFRCMKNLSFDDLEKIRSHKYNFTNRRLEHEMNNIIQRLLMKRKNIMLYLPKIIETSDLYGAIDFINEALDSMLKFRKKYVNKDLYFTFITTNNVNKKNTYKFVILKLEDDKLKYIDSVYTNCSKYFYKERKSVV